MQRPPIISDEVDIVINLSQKRVLVWCFNSVKDGSRTQSTELVCRLSPEEAWKAARELFTAAFQLGYEPPKET